jgi:hypothetical protein
MKLNYSTSEINRNFKIKVFGRVNGRKINTLVGVSGLIDLLDGAIDLVNRLLDRAFSSMGDVCHCKLRRGLKISFYVF